MMLQVNCTPTIAVKYVKYKVYGGFKVDADYNWRRKVNLEKEEWEKRNLPRK